MQKRLLIFLTCCALIFGALGHVSGPAIDPAGDAATPAAATASRLSEPVADQTLTPFDVSMAGCLGHAHGASGGCTVDGVAPSPSFGAPDRIWRVSRWIETSPRLESAPLSPTLPPPISMS